MADEGNIENIDWENAKIVPPGVAPDPEPTVPLEGDWFLRQLIELADQGIEIPVTLTIGGNQLNGYIIGGRTYFERVAQDTRDSVAKSDERMQTLFGSIADLYAGHADIYPTVENAGPIGSADHQYIHLRDARWFNNFGDPFPGNSMLWRGRLEAIEGFSFGVMQATRS